MRIVSEINVHMGINFTIQPYAFYIAVCFSNHIFFLWLKMKWHALHCVQVKYALGLSMWIGNDRRFG